MGNQAKRSKTTQQNSIEEEQQELSEGSQPLSVRLSEWSHHSLPIFLEGNIAKNIHSLSLKSCQVGPEGVKMMSKVHWPRLENLILIQNRLGNHGILHLTKMRCKHIKNMNLMGNGLRDQGCKSMTKGNWRWLVHLTLNQNYGIYRDKVNQITQSGIRSVRLLPIDKSFQLRPTKAFNIYRV